MVWTGKGENTRETMKSNALRVRSPKTSAASKSAQPKWLSRVCLLCSHEELKLKQKQKQKQKLMLSTRTVSATALQMPIWMRVFFLSCCTITKTIHHSHNHASCPCTALARQASSCSGHVFPSHDNVNSAISSSTPAHRLVTSPFAMPAQP